MINIAAAEVDNNLKPKLSVLGIGGAGANAVNNMVDSGLEGVDFLVANTDAQDLATSKAQRKIQLGMALTKGLGAGANPEVGREAAEETLNEIIEALSDSNMVFVTAGMGGGTGSGASPVICQALRERGILTVGVITKPFDFEGKQRSKIADASLEDMKEAVDTLVIIPNQNLFNVIDKSTSFDEAFKLTDDVLHDGISSITDLITKQGRMNKDFADVKTIIGKKGEAIMGTGSASGEDRAEEAAKKAIANPLLDNVSMKGAKGILINITSSRDITLFEMDSVTRRVRDEIDPNDDAEFIFGNTYDDDMGDTLKVSIVATGLTHQGGAYVKQTVKPRVSRPMMDDGAKDITEISFEETEEVQEDLEGDDILTPGLFNADLMEDSDDEVEDPIVEEKVFEEFEQDEDIPRVEENIIKISESGEVIRPVQVAPIFAQPVVETPVKEAEEKQGFLNRIRKSKDKKEEEMAVEAPAPVEESREDFEDIQLPDFLQRK